MSGMMINVVQINYHEYTCTILLYIQRYTPENSICYDVIYNDWYVQQHLKQKS